MEFPKKPLQRLENRKANNALRELKMHTPLIDFSSNDYLGFSKSEIIFNETHKFLVGHNITENGATGSRLLSGNHPLFNIVESMISNFHKSESALIFNSGYDANVGFFSCLTQRGDIILYDEYIHASIRDGISLSNAKAYKFKHNDLESLSEMLNRLPYDNAYIVTESVFSMDGDSPDLTAIAEISKKNNAFLVIDEAHAIGVFGERGAGLVQDLNLEHIVFARIVTFGKALGCHGAAILGSEELKHYLVNFARSFIYTTALPPHSLATIHTAYHQLIENSNKNKLHENISFFKSEMVKNKLNHTFIESNSAIQSCVISGNEKVKTISKNLQNHGFDVKPILSPTVSVGQERLRFCLHSYNSEQEISKVLELLTTFVS